MENNILLNEINIFIESVNKGGLPLIDYVQTTKRLKNKVNMIAERKINFLRYVLYLDMITLEQYYKHKSLIQNEKIYYKTLLNSI